MSDTKKGRERDVPRAHIFDGIYEYDNDLPRWWVMLFILTIVFAGGYLAWYHGGVFPSVSLEGEYAATVASAKAAAAKKDVAAGAFDFKAAAKDAGVVGAGKELFTTNCAPCHGAAGQGVVGPNLTDDHWVNGATAAAVEKIITAGNLEKGMPAWGEILGRDKIRQVVAFILTIQGTTPADAKAPQGESGHLQ